MKIHQKLYLAFSTKVLNTTPAVSITLHPYHHHPAIPSPIPSSTPLRAPSDPLPNSPISAKKLIIGAAGYRSPYLAHAKRALYHLSYSPDDVITPRGLGIVPAGSPGAGGKQTGQKEKKNPFRTGFEPARAEPNGLAVHRLNHSAT